MDVALKYNCIAIASHSQVQQIDNVVPRVLSQALPSSRRPLANILKPILSRGNVSFPPFLKFLFKDCMLKEVWGCS